MQKVMQILGVFDCKQIFQVVEELEENHDMAGQGANHRGER